MSLMDKDFSHPTLTAEHEKALYNYIWGIIKEKKGHLYRINGMEDHIQLHQKAKRTP